MITFYRNLRRTLAAENKFLKYSRYAFGEIVLVVIGILIALQINNWNENKKKHVAAVQHLKTIAQNLKEDINQLEYMKHFTDTSMIAAKHLAHQFQTIEPVSRLTPTYIFELIIEKQTNPNKSGFETLNSSESLADIPVEIKDLLFKYYNGLDNIAVREEISNTFIKNRYEPYFFEHYHDLINKNTQWTGLNNYFANDPREGKIFNEEKFLKDGTLEAMIFGRYFQIEKQNILYDDVKLTAQNLLQKINDFD